MAEEKHLLPLNGDMLTRLEKGLHEQQLSYQSTRDDVNSLKAGYNVIQRDMMSMMSAVEKLVARFEDTRKTNWPLLALMCGLLPLLIGGLAFFMSSYTASAISPLKAELVQLQAMQKSTGEQVKDIATIQISRGKDISLLAQTAATNNEIIQRMSTGLRSMEEKIATSTSADVNSRTDRAQLNDRMGKVEISIASESADRRQQSAETRVILGEVEQQFHAVSNLENLRFAQQERINAMVWEKTHPGEKYPNSIFFPTSLFQGPGGSAPLLKGNNNHNGQ